MAIGFIRSSKDRDPLVNPSLDAIHLRIAKHENWCRKNCPHLYATQKPKRKPRGMGAQSRRMERERMAGKGWTAAEWQACVEYHAGKCLRCGDTEKLVPDHVIPMKRGGEHHIRNIQPLCSKCNLWKGLKVIDFRSSCPIL